MKQAAEARVGREPPLTSQALSVWRIEEYWPQLEPLIEKSLKNSRREFSADYVYEALKQAAFIAFVAERNGKVELCLIVELCGFPNYKVLNILALGGKNLKDCDKYHKAFEDWAIFQGAVEIRAFVQNPAALRLYRRLQPDYRPAYTVLINDLRRRLQ